MSTPTSRRSTRRVAGPVELLDAIPYLLGFHPSESLVLLGLDDGTLVVTARMDLADVTRPGLVPETLESLRRGGVRQLIAVVVDDDCAPPPSNPFQDLPGAQLIDDLDDAVVEWGLELVGALLCRDGRWWSYFRGPDAHRPPDGYPLSEAPSAFAASAAFDGIVALPDRAALARTLEPLPELERAALGPCVADAENAQVAAVLDDRSAAHDRALVRELLQAARASGVAEWTVPDDATAARLAVALGTTEVRDRVWLDVDSRSLDGRRLWAELARRCPAPYDAAPLFLFGWASWRAGNGALAGMAAGRALAADPEYYAADLLLAAVTQAVDPRTFPPLRGAGSGRGVRGRRPPGRRGGAAPTPR